MGAAIIALLANAASIFGFLVGPVRRTVGWLLFRAQDPRRLVRKRTLSYADVDRAISDLAPDVHHYGPELIVAVDRGGAIVAGLLAKKLKRLRGDIPIVVLPRPEFEPPGSVAGKKVLLVDDAFRQGVSMEKAKSRLDGEAAKVGKIAVIILEERHTYHGLNPRDVPLLRVYKTERAVDLPWDIQPLQVKE